MTRITIDDELRAKLLDFREDLELCDKNGFVVARVQRSTPWTDPENWTEFTPEMSDEEWQRIKESGDFGISTQDLINHLKDRA